MKRITLLLSALFTASVATAGGFQVNLQGIRQTGMAHCGAGLAFDASSCFFNPGALGFAGTDGMSPVAQTGFSRTVNSIVIGINAVSARIAYNELAPGAYSAGNASELPAPFSVYGALRLSSAFTAGLGVYTPFGSTVRYEDDWKGQFLLRELSLRTIFIQPTLAWKKGKWGIGLGGVFAVGSVSLRKGVPAQFADGQYGEVLLKGSGSGYGFNTGVFYRAGRGFTLGASLRSGVGFNAKSGSATFTVPTDLAQYFPSTTFSSRIRLPWTATIGGAFKPKSGIRSWTFALDASLVGWSVYDTLSFDFEQNTDKLADSHSPREYHNAFIVRAGAERQLGEKLIVRAGMYFDGTPVQAGYLTPETPDASKLGFSGGASLYVTKGIRIDASFLWVEGMRREDTNLETQFSGSWKGRAVIPSVGVSFNRINRVSPVRIDADPSF